MKKIFRNLFLLIIIIGCIYCQYRIINIFKLYSQKEGIIDKFGNVVIDYNYRNVDFTDIMGNEKYIQVDKYTGLEYLFKHSNTVCYIDLNGNEYSYDSVPNYHENRAFVYDEILDKYGYIDENSYAITDYIYDYIYESEFTNGFAKVLKDGKYGLIDSNGKNVLPCEYEYIYYIFYGEFFVVKKDGENYLINNKEEVLGKIIEEENEIQTIEFKNVNNLNFDKKLIWSDEDGKSDIGIEKSFICINDNNKSVIFDEDLKKIAEVDSIRVSTVDNCSIYLIYNKNRKYLVDKDFNELMDCSEYDVDSFNQKILRIKKDNKFGVIDYNKNIIINPEYEMVGVADNYLVAEKDKIYNVFDLDGNLLFKSKKSIEVLGNGDYFVSVKYDKKTAIILGSAILLFGVIEIYCIMKFFYKKEKPTDG